MGRKSKGEVIPGQLVELPAGSVSANPLPEVVGFGEAVDEVEVVELLKQHTHDGQDYAVGHKLSVRPPIADWLRARGVIAPLSQDPA